MSEPSQSRTRWLRDVGVNVIANLVAAAIIYLLAVAFGYVKAHPVPVIVSTAFLITFLAGITVGYTAPVGIEYLWKARRSKTARTSPETPSQPDPQDKPE
ncbi:MAG: hypothetical protein QOE71_2754 [Pseudonocardiales bacterium]|nr:hypothetical protein [Pseudonocardiales bacterium]